MIGAEQIVLEEDNRWAGQSFQKLKAKVVADFERCYLGELLTRCGGNITRAAQVARKHRRALWQLMQKHGIRGPSTIGSESTEAPINSCQLADPLNQDPIKPCNIT